MPTPTKLRLNYSFGFPRLGLLSQSVRNHLISASQVIRPIDPCPRLKESNLQQPSYFSFLKSCSFFLLPEVFILYSSLGGFLSICQVECCPVPINFCFSQLLKFVTCLSLSFNTSLYVTGTAKNKRKISTLLNYRLHLVDDNGMTERPHMEKCIHVPQSSINQIL